MSGILIISGTNRPASNTRRISDAVLRHYQSNGLEATILDLVNLPPEVFVPGIYAAKPESFRKIQQQVLDAAGLHVITPEYNGSFPGILKYFIDLLKFPESFERKPVAFVGLADGVFGALRPVEQLQMVFAYRNAHLYPDRVFIAGAKRKMDSQGMITDPDLDARLSRQARGFAHFAAGSPATFHPDV